MTIQKTSKAEKAACRPCLSNDDIQLKTEDRDMWVQVFPLLGSEQDFGKCSLPCSRWMSNHWAKGDISSKEDSYEIFWVEIFNWPETSKIFQYFVWFVSFQVRQFHSLLSLEPRPYKAFTFLSRMSFLISTHDFAFMVLMESHIT